MENHAVPVSSSEELNLSELERALITIRLECKKHEHCSQCPLYDKRGERCFIADSGMYPEDWSLECDELLENTVRYVFK